MKTQIPMVTEAGWYVELPGPAETVLTRKYKELGKVERQAADAQAYLYLLERPKLRRTLTALSRHRGMATLVKSLAAEDALRWGDLIAAAKLYGELAKHGSVAGGNLAAWARLREVEVLERGGRMAEARIKLDAARLIDADTGLTPVLTAIVAARLRFRRGDPAGALALLEETPPTDDRPSPVRGAWLRGQAIYTSLTGRADRALGQHKRALDCFCALGDRYHLVKQRLSLAQTCLEGGELDHAELYCDKAADALAGTSHPHLQALVASRSGMIALLRGDLERARVLFAEDLDLCEEAELMPGRYYARRNLGKVLVRLGRPADGAEYLAASYRGFRSYGDPVNQRLSRVEEIAARLGTATDEQLTEWNHELQIIAGHFAKRNRPALGVQVDAVLARLHICQGALPLARDLIEQVVATWRRTKRRDRLVEFLSDVAAAYPKAHHEEAERYLRLAYREAENAGQSRAASRVLKALDESSELAALELARAPRIPTSPGLGAGLGAGMGAGMGMGPGGSIGGAGIGMSKNAAAPAPITGGFYHQSRSEPFRRLLEEARNVAQSDLTVLLLGETGTGKDWLAQYVYRSGRRADQLYRAYNCGAVAESVLEAELFGYEKGAFTGAEQSRVGIFEAADGGTVLLDEVSELSPRAQAALLRVLEQRVVQPVGSTQPRPVDVRILAATNQNLTESVAEGRFRSDLYYRLAVYTLTVPALRHRTEDIPLLVVHFLERLGDALRRQIRAVDDAALEALMRYQWPGNLRELDNVLQGAVIRCKGQTIRRKHLPSYIAEPSGLYPLSGFASLADLEKKHIKEALKQARGNQSEAANMLGIHRNTLANRMRKYGIEG